MIKRVQVRVRKKRGIKLKKGNIPSCSKENAGAAKVPVTIHNVSTITTAAATIGQNQQHNNHQYGSPSPQASYDSM